MPTNTDHQNQTGQSHLGKYCPEHPDPDKISAALRPPIGTIELIGQADEYTTRTRNRDALPDLEGFDYHASIEQYGSTEVIEYWQFNSPSRWDSRDIEPENIPGSAGVIIKHADKYLREHALAPIDFPEYYSRFPDMDPVHRWSIDGDTHLNGYDLKRIVRLVNGKGRIDTDSTHLVLCDPGTVVAAGPRGIFLVDIKCPYSQTNVEMPDPPEEVYYNIGGIALPEEDPQLRAGFKRLTSILKQTALSPLDHYHELSLEEPPLTHTIKTADGETVTLTASILKGISQHDRSKADIAGTTYTNYCGGADWDVTPTESDIPGEIRDTVTLDGIVGTIVGYDTRWIDNEYVYSGGVNTTEFQLSAFLLTKDHALKDITQPIKTIDV